MTLPSFAIDAREYTHPFVSILLIFERIVVAAAVFLLLNLVSGYDVELTNWRLIWVNWVGHNSMLI